MNGCCSKCGQVVTGQAANFAPDFLVPADQVSKYEATTLSVAMMMHIFQHHQDDIAKDVHAVGQVFAQTFALSYLRTTDNRLAAVMRETKAMIFERLYSEAERKRLELDAIERFIAAASPGGALDYETLRAALEHYRREAAAAADSEASGLHFGAMRMPDKLVV